MVQQPLQGGRKVLFDALKTLLSTKKRLKLGFLLPMQALELHALTACRLLLHRRFGPPGTLSCAAATLPLQIVKDCLRAGKAAFVESMVRVGSILPCAAAHPALGKQECCMSPASPPTCTLLLPLAGALSAL